MIEADLQFLAQYDGRLPPSGLSAMRLHLSRLHDGLGFIAMVDALKARHLPAFAREAVRRPAAMRHFSMPVKARLARLRAAL